MCTALTYKTKDFYFGRTFDYEFSYGEELVITPRNYKFNFRKMGELKTHYALMGVAHVEDNFPLYYDCINEKGLAMAGLNFTNNAFYFDISNKKYNVASFEIIQFILSTCASVKEVKEILNDFNIINVQFNEKFPNSSLHFIIADNKECITVESCKDGLHIYDNKIGVLTNNPPFPLQIFNLNNYSSLSNKQPKNNINDKYEVDLYSRGMGLKGLPGDLSSSSRFVKVALTKLFSMSNDDEISSMNQFFHILHSVEQQRGLCEVEKGKYEITIYTDCYNVNKGIFYYNTYDNHQISSINMHNENLDSDNIIRYPMIMKEQINYIN